MSWLRPLIVALFCCSSLVAWLVAYLNSPAEIKELAAKKSSINRVLKTGNYDSEKEKLLAEAYWLRYPTLAENSRWGRKGPMGILGPRDHFRNHGRLDGWIWGPVMRPSDMKRETELAHAYWKRYPEIARSKVWGQNSNMGILAPRDHYHYIGRFQGKKWGLEQQ